MSDIGSIISAVTEIVKRFIPDPKDKLEAEKELTKSMTSLINTEVNSESWLTRTWRPWFMFMLTNLVLFWGFNNFVFAPYLKIWFDITLPMLKMPAEFWALLMVGFGIYSGARTLEKIALTILGKITWRR